jgi:formylglycine-generating enzyme required for sulfatase activity
MAAQCAERSRCLWSILVRYASSGDSQGFFNSHSPVMSRNPSYYAKTRSEKHFVEKVAALDTSNHPVEGVNWNDMAEFCAKISEQEKLQPFYFRSGDTVTSLDGAGYRMPTEAEWEFACRAGTTTNFWLGNLEDDLMKAGWFGRNSGGRTLSVGELTANPFA